jgi:hypothetical protein
VKLEAEVNCHRALWLHKNPLKKTFSANRMNSKDCHLRLRLAKSYVVGISVLEEETLAFFKMLIASSLTLKQLLTEMRPFREK